MEKILESQSGVAGLIAGLIIILCLHLLLNVGKFVFFLVKKKGQENDAAIKELTHAIARLDSRMSVLERDLNEVLKFRLDFRRLFAAVKYLAGDKWPEARKAMKDHDLDLYDGK